MKILQWCLLATALLWVGCEHNQKVEQGGQPENMIENTGIMLSEEEKAYLIRYFSQDRIQQIDSLFTLYHENHNFHGSVLISEHGKVIYENQFGYSDIKNEKDVTPYTPFQLASVSKPLTAFAILQLAEEGKLDIADPLDCYFPELPYDVTLEQLLHHTAGLPNYMWLVENFWNKPYPPYNDDVIAMMAEHELNYHFFPGRRYAYSNTGYMLLASVVEKVSGQYFADYMDEAIFSPLGMDNTMVFSSAMGCRNDYMAKGHRQNWRGNYTVPLTDLDGTVGDKGIYSTTRDLLKWQNALDNETLMSSEALAQAFEPVELSNGNTYDYGLGWRLRFNEEPSYVYHNGLWYGFRSSMQRYMEENVNIIVLNNTNNRNMNNLLSMTKSRLYQPRDVSLAEKVVRDMIETPRYSMDDIFESLEEYDQKELEQEIKMIAGLFEKLERNDIALDIRNKAGDVEGINLADTDDGSEELEQVGGDF